MVSIFSFPNPVNETSARVVATGAVALGVLFLLTGSGWVLVPLTYGFAARVLAGPTLSPLGRLATQVVTPALEKRGHRARLVPGPPKRFAQGIGVLFSLTAVALHFGFGATGAAYVVLGLLAAAASLEAFLGFCCGCTIFAALMRAGVIPDDTCEACNDIWGRATV